MSIIYDALNKVQNKTKDSTPVKNQTPKKNKRLFMIVFAIGLVLTALIMLIKDHYPLEKVSKVITQNMQPKNRLGENTDRHNLENVHRDEEFYLSGIFFTDSHGTAIINDDIVTIGDLVGKAKVTEIGDDSVELEQEGEKFTLSMR